MSVESVTIGPGFFQRIGVHVPDDRVEEDADAEIEDCADVPEDIFVSHTTT